jgi:hypothetical protein
MKLDIDFLISVIAALLIMSIVAEKLTQLIRHYPRRFSIIGLCIALFLIFSAYASYQAHIIAKEVIQLKVNSLVIHFEWHLWVYLALMTLLLVDTNYNSLKIFSKLNFIIPFNILNTFWLNSLILTSGYSLVMIMLNLPTFKLDFVIVSIPIFFLTFLVLGILGHQIQMSRVRLQQLAFFALIPLFLVITQPSIEFWNIYVCYVLGISLLYFSLISLKYINPIEINRKGEQALKLNFFQNIGKGTNPDNEYKKVKEISLLSFLVSIAIVFLMNDSIFFFVENVQSKIPINYAIIELPFNVDGYLMLSKEAFRNNIEFNQLFWMMSVAFFLTFGSQFFHDLIDRLYLIKEAKKNLVNTNPNTELTKRNRELELENLYFTMQKLDQQRNSEENEVRLNQLSSEIDSYSNRAKELTQLIYGNK